MASSDYEDLTPKDRLAVMDMPGDETVASNIRLVTAVTRSAVIERAAKSP